MNETCPKINVMKGNENIYYPHAMYDGAFLLALMGKNRYDMSQSSSAVT
jgi:hypothetical protein